jgi:hypothetical protein
MALTLTQAQIDEIRRLRDARPNAQLSVQWRPVACRQRRPELVPWLGGGPPL